MAAFLGIEAPAFAVSIVCLSLWWFFKAYFHALTNGTSNHPLPPPEIPGLPVIGNLLQLKEKKPHKTFTKWAETYGPIYSIKTGTNKMVVLNSTSVAREAMVTKYSSISSRKLSKALKILTCDKNMVAMSDYDNFYKTAKRHIFASVVGTSAQKRHRLHRDALVENTVEKLHLLLSTDPQQAVTLRKIFQLELFGLSMKVAFGRNVESIYVEDLGTTFSSEQLLKALATDITDGAIEVDWRDFFPYLKWIPNKSLETRIQQIDIRREAVMKSLITKQKKRIESGEKLDCYLDYLLEEAASFTEKQILMLLWETIAETSDTTSLTTEWAMYEIAKNPDKQDRLYQSIIHACGGNKVSEENINQIPYLSAIFHETLRRYNPVPIIPLRHVHEDTELGGYYIAAGTEIAINLYGCNMDKNEWECPEEWKPERFLDSKYEQMDLYKTMAFGGGKRMCAGSVQAMLMSCVTIARLVQEFEWRLADGEKDNIHTLGLTSQKLHPMRAIIKPRN